MGSPLQATRGALNHPAPGGVTVCYRCAEVTDPKHPRHAEKPSSAVQKSVVSPPIRSENALDEAWFAISAPGLEGALAQELHTLPGLSEIAQVDGGITFKGALEAGYAVNLGSRIATRVLVRLGEVQAREFPVLRKRTAALPFERYLSADRPLRIDASARHCRLYHTGGVAEALLNAASDRLGAALQLSKGAESATASPIGPFGSEPFARLLIRGQDDCFTVSVDSSGLLLHLRGARAETGRAPLRETLAAGLLSLAGYRGDEPLVNAMCGAGTIALEAAGIALARTPGRNRHFACESFPCFERASFDTVRAQLGCAERKRLPAPIIAFDNDARAVAIAQRNAARAEHSQDIQFVRADMRDFKPPTAHGLLIANPPYGQRLGDLREARELYREMGKALRARWRGWRIALVVPREVSEDVFGLVRAQSLPLQNGGLRVKLLVGTV